MLRASIGFSSQTNKSRGYQFHLILSINGLKTHTYLESLVMTGFLKFILLPPRWTTRTLPCSTMFSQLTTFTSDLWPFFVVACLCALLPPVGLECQNTAKIKESNFIVSANRFYVRLRCHASLHLFSEVERRFIIIQVNYDIWGKNLRNTYCFIAFILIMKMPFCLFVCAAVQVLVYRQHQNVLACL